MRYHFMSLTTGALERNIVCVIRTVVKDIIKFKMLNVRWTYSRKGF